MIKVALPAPFRGFAPTFIFRNIRDDAIVPERLPRSTGIKPRIGIEERTFVVKVTALHVRKQFFDRSLEIKGIIMVAGNNVSRRNDSTILVD